MSRTHLILAAIAAILLWPSVALAADGTTSPPELISLIFANWGQWSVVAGIGILIAVQVWRTRIKPEVWESMPSLLRRALPPAISALTAAGGAIASGGTWAEFAQVFVAQWVTLEWAAGLAGAAKARSFPTKPAAVTRGSDGVPAGGGSFKKASGPPAAAMVFLLVALGLPGCAAVRPVIDGADSVCALALAEEELVQDAAERYGWPLEQTASWLCGFPEVFDAWDAALMQRSADPAEAAVAVARDGGLL